ncbi:MAG TPA: helix-turn-helix transcriptional regulator [Bacteroidales bacterium]
MITRIKRIIDDKQINAAQFADEIGVQRSALSHVLSGRNNPSLDFMLKIKKAYPEINLDWLMIGSGQMIENTSSEKKVTSSSSKSVLEIEFPDKESEGSMEKTVVQPTNESVKPAEPVKALPKSHGNKTPTQIIVLYSDNTFEIFEENSKK